VAHEKRTVVALASSTGACLATQPTQRAPVQEPGSSPDLVRLGRRLNAATYPGPLRPLQSASKKLVWTALEARKVRTPVRYALRELLHPVAADYEIRRSQAKIRLRHRSGDIDIFRKFYAYGYYDWPSEVVTLLRSLERPINLVDLGANIGLFDVHVGESFETGRVVAFEPDPGNAAVLERVCDSNAADWEIIRACASNRAGTAMFQSGSKNFSRIESTGDLSVPTVDVFPYVSAADLVKMNIEGSEWEILQDERFAETSPVWIVEYHRIRNPPGDVGDLARSFFERAGYRTRLVFGHEENGLLWAWRDPERSDS
jgi:FkbM family methyltransferase